MNEQFSVLFVCQRDLTGPSEKQMMGFAQRLVRRGHRILFSFGGSAATAAGEGLSIVNGIEFREHRFKGRRLRPADIDRGREFRPDLIHVANSRLPTIMAAREYRRATARRRSCISRTTNGTRGAGSLGSRSTTGRVGGCDGPRA